MTYLMTLDSHEYFGPFLDDETARYWAEKTGRTSYQLIPAASLPRYAKDQTQQPRFS